MIDQQSDTFHAALEMYQSKSWHMIHMFQADLSPSWNFPHAPKQAGSSPHEL